MNEPTYKLEEAIALHQNGKPEAALALYHEHLACHPEDPQTIYLLGTALLQLGKGEESIKYLEQAEEKFPNIPDISNNTGIAYQSIGNWEQAEKAFQRSIQINADYGQAYFNYGSLLFENHRLEEAETNLKQAVRLSPGDCEVKETFANVLKAQNKWKEASDCYHSMLHLPQVSLDSLVNYAFVLIQQNRLDEAIEVYAQILTRKPDYYQIYNSLGFLLEKQGKLPDALSLIERSLEYNPEYLEGWNNKGVVQQSLYQFEDAKVSFNKALSINPEFSLSRYNLGTIYLIQEQYQQGWDGFACHTQLNQADHYHDSTVPVWNGDAISQKQLLVYVDQGLGDALMFVRFLDALKKKSLANVSLECPNALSELFKKSFPEYQILIEGEHDRTFDYRLPISLSPVVLNVSVDDLPLKKQYIQDSGNANTRLKEFLERSPGKKKIGLCWQGNPKQARDNVRSCPLLLLEILLGKESVEWYSFQVDDMSQKQLDDSGLSQKMIDLGGELESFSDTAFALSKMDLLITVDTSMAHLAGAMGVPTWTMLCHLPDWRWHLDRTDSQWYPEMKLFRQPRWGDWNSLIMDLKESIDNQF